MRSPRVDQRGDTPDALSAVCSPVTRLRTRTVDCETVGPDATYASHRPSGDTEGRVSSTLLGTPPTAVPEPNFLVSPRTSIFTVLLRSRFCDGHFRTSLGDFQHNQDCK